MKKKELKDHLEYVMAKLREIDEDSECQWVEGISYPSIIGYLQGSIRVLYKSYDMITKNVQYETHKRTKKTNGSYSKKNASKSQAK